MIRNVGEVGFWAGVAACGATLSFVVVQLLQLVGVLRFPLDEIAIYGTSLCIVMPFLLEMLALHHLSTGAKRFWAHAALLLSVLYAGFVTANYVVQLATVIPAKLARRDEAIRILDQTPHSLFWDFDAIGYLCMGLAALCAAPALGETAAERRAQWAMLAHALVTPLIAIVYFAPTFSERLLLLAFPWAITAPAFMLALAFVLRERPSRGARGD